ncbi:hypothetical protein Landi51_03384 [Colletotrichum acutatum]
MASCKPTAFRYPNIPPAALHGQALSLKSTKVIHPNPRPIFAPVSRLHVDSNPLYPYGCSFFSFSIQPSDAGCRHECRLLMNSHRLTSPPPAAALHRVRTYAQSSPQPVPVQVIVIGLQPLLSRNDCCQRTSLHRKPQITQSRASEDSQDFPRRFPMLPRPKPPRQETQTGPSSYCWHVPSPALISSTSATRGVWVSPSLRHQTRPPRETGTRHHGERKKRHALDQAKEEG